MSDASTIDPAAILQRVGEIEARLDGPSVNITARALDAIWLCQTLRTALADTRRVDWLETNTSPGAWRTEIDRQMAKDSALATTPSSNHG